MRLSLFKDWVEGLMSLRLLKIAPKCPSHFVQRCLLRSTDSSRPNIPWRERVWSIGIYAGTSPFDLKPSERVDNPVLTAKDVTDMQANLIADPFMIRVGQTWYMFFEVLGWETNCGRIGLATSQDGFKWTYHQIVLAEPFHLSYPCVFEWAGDYYMIPESCQADSVRLYRASDFPTQWSLVGTLLNGNAFLDSSIFRYDDIWWLFTGISHHNDALGLYYANNLLGPWFGHPRNPILEGNPRISRPAGRVVKFNGRVVRYAQDCRPLYGTGVRAFEIRRLTLTHYREREVRKSPILTAGGAGWNCHGMHHVDPHLMEDGQWIACVDGWSVETEVDTSCLM